MFICFNSIGWTYLNRYWNRLKVYTIQCIQFISFLAFLKEAAIKAITECFVFVCLDVEPLVFSFRVKFFPADPFRLTGNSKIMIYQQLKRDLIHGRLYCSAGEAAALGSLIVQGNSFICLLSEMEKWCGVLKQFA